jgi:cathepsin L
MKVRPYQKRLCLFVFLLLAGCSDSSQPLPGYCNNIDVSGFAKLTLLPANTTSTAAADWRSKGAVTPVKNEGDCFVSWAFGSTALVEGYHAITTGMLLSLSEQQMIDCDSGSNACSGGGNPIESLKNMIGQNGLQTEASYPYIGAQGICKFDSSHLAATIPGVGLLPAGDEESLKYYVATVGPVLAFIDACHQSFLDYKSGIYYEPMCSSIRPTHAVIIVGYGSDSGSDYWIVKASLGTSWGENGYIRMSRNHDNNCGIASYALSPANLPLE